MKITINHQGQLSVDKNVVATITVNQAMLVALDLLKFANGKFDPNYVPKTVKETK